MFFSWDILEDALSPPDCDIFSDKAVTLAWLM
jgi:hypothetical protein